ncbi:uncharacterized protein LAJ45_01501 [Morchella importuna]|uniref:uncharacterized protein n=1 Tax=Morchella importuna TaxID=1174673 RepID=UPI001E8CCD7A|nr:uncharacterized protein LAJ45_01501 [Morchella importuna]KAH8154968.1 hypothetical protein LAJ45_01501 [Morchella importuna]
MLFKSFLVAAVLPFLATAYEDPLVTLDYVSLQGKYNEAYNISYFRRIPFAAPPVGENRFRGPQPVGTFDGVYDADIPYDMCPQRTVNGSEDCLYLTLYSRPWTEGAPKKPVMMFFYGGGFIQGAAGLTLPPSSYPVLNVSESTNYIAVYPNYRTNAFGLLPGKKIKESPTSDLNPGLLDQQAALKWVNKYISKFGGDPKNVTVWGQSAGGGSVVAQVLANGGNTSPKLFTKAIASSPFWPRNYRYDAPEAEEIYSTLANLTGCATADDSLKCLKEVDVQKIRDANQIINAMHTTTTSSYTWAPVIDGEFLRESLSSATEKGRVNSDYAIGMYNRFEGSTFVSSALNKAASTGTSGTAAWNSTEEGFRFWLDGFLPGLKEQHVTEVKALYPPATTNGSTVYTTQQDRAGYVYRDVVLACPGYWISTASKKAGYVGEYTISPAKHASDVGYWNTVNSLQTTQRFLYQGYAGAYASFIETGNPNANKLTNDSVVAWPEVKSGKEWIVQADGFAEDSLTMLKKRCDLWKKVGKYLPL